MEFWRLIVSYSAVNSENTGLSIKVGLSETRKIKPRWQRFLMRA